LGEFFFIRTHHQTLIVENIRSGLVRSAAEADVGFQHSALFMYVPDQKQDACFLISGGNAPLRLEPNLSGDGVISLGLARGFGQSVSLYDPVTGLWACGTPPDEGVPLSGRLVMVHDVVQEFERFTLCPVERSAVPDGVQAVAARLDQILALPFDAALPGHLLAGDSAPAPDASPARGGPLLEACFRLLPVPVQQRFAESVLSDPAAARDLAALFPDDIMCWAGVRELSAWLAARDRPAAPGPLRLDTRYDDTATVGFGGGYVSLPQAVTALARQSIQPGKTLAIVATARNEGIYLLEWLAYHRAIGVEQVFLYTNDNDDGSDELLARLSDAGALCWISSTVGPGGNAQRKAYGHAFGLNPAVLDYRWSLVIDLDEYLAFNSDLFRSATDLVNWYEAKGAEAVALNWVVLGSAGQARWRDGFIADRFPYSLAAPSVPVKTLRRSNRFIHSAPHVPWSYRNTPFTFLASDGRPHVPLGDEGGLSHSARPTAQFAWINHYFFKSTEEYLWKWSRNRGGQATVPGPTTTALTEGFVRSFAEQFENRSERAANLRDNAPGFDAELNRLLALPGVAEAHATVLGRFRDRMQLLIPMFEAAQGIRDAGPAGEALLSTIRG